MARRVLRIFGSWPLFPLERAIGRFSCDAALAPHLKIAGGFERVLVMLDPGRL